MKIFEKYEEFKKYVGLLEEDFNWSKIGIEPDNDMFFSVDRLQELLKFVEKNPEYHIVTHTSDGDGDDNDTMDNTIRIVNRLGYCLANGSREPAFLQEKLFQYNTEEEKQ